MDTNEISGRFQNISQRVVSSHRRMLAEFSPVALDGLTPADQADLYGFFQALYDAMYSDPARFGLPVTEDVYITQEHSKEGPDKTEIKRRLDKPRKLVSEGLDFLYAFGQDGRLEGDTLVLDPANPVLAFTKKKPGRAWLNGLANVGLTLTQAGEVVTLANAKFPKMMPALQALVQHCAQCPDPNLARVFFARCDFKALRHDFTVQAPDLFRLFPTQDAAWAAEMHTYFTRRGYTAQVEIGRMFSWVVKYQGKKSIKATPLFQIDFDERCQHQMRANIKCASAQRVAPLVPTQSQALQDDFARRAHPCGDCHWCDNQKSLGPVEYTYQGETRKVCWYVPSDIHEFSGETIALVQEYALLHERLN